MDALYSTIEDKKYQDADKHLIIVMKAIDAQKAEAAKAEEKEEAKEAKDAEEKDGDAKDEKKDEKKSTTPKERYTMKSDDDYSGYSDECFE